MTTSVAPRLVDGSRLPSLRAIRRVPTYRCYGAYVAYRGRLRIRASEFFAVQVPVDRVVRWLEAGWEQMS